MNYGEFLETKRDVVKPVGFDVADEDLNNQLFDWQRKIVQWVVMRGRAALFEDCGLGKTAQQVEWSRIVSGHTGKPVLILAPLAVSDQTVREGEKFGIHVTKCVRQSDVAPGVNVTNYEKLEKFAPEGLGGIVLDESSILKAYDGKTRRQITDFAKGIGYRLCCTATPAPNDLVELCNHAEFLDIMSGKEILALFFRQDGNTTHKWRLKGHAKAAFWQWMAEWSIALRRPSDIGFSDDRFVLPPLVMHEDSVVNEKHDGFLFAVEAKTLSERRRSRRDSLDARVARAAALANDSHEQWCVWCDLNCESERLAAAIRGAVEVKGSDSDDHKERTLRGFADVDVRVLVSKPSIAGFGMNFQRCHNVAFVGLSDSYEAFYQAIRRCWRFGQTSPVHCHVICSDSDGAVVENIRRKDDQAQEMFDSVVKAMDGLNSLGGASRRNEMDYRPGISMTTPDWLVTIK